MAQLVHADPTDLQGLADKLQQSRSDLESLVAAIVSRLGQSSWQGAASDNFRNVWDQQRQNLNKGSEALDATRTALMSWKQNLEQLDSAGFRA